MNRRSFLSLSVSVAAGSVVYSMTMTRDGTVVRHDTRFNQLVPADSQLEKLADGFDWAEGPVWQASEKRLLFSDIPKNKVWQWSKKGGLATFLEPSGYTGTSPRGGERGCNGLALDQAGKLLLCQHGDRRIARLNDDGKSFTTLADRYEGKRFNSPNDLVLHTNGDIYFTDPPYGLEKGPNDPNRELNFCGVYRLDTRGKVTLLTKELTRPNGIGFSPDYKTLYIANSDPLKAYWMSFPVKEDGMLGEGKIFYDVTMQVPRMKGLPDGLKVDRQGNLFATGPGGVWVFTAQAELLGRIDPGCATANCGFGEKGMLYLTADKSLYAIATSTQGLF